MPPKDRMEILEQTDISGSWNLKVYVVLPHDYGNITQPRKEIHMVV